MGTMSDACFFYPVIKRQKFYVSMHSCAGVRHSLLLNLKANRMSPGVSSVLKLHEFVPFVTFFVLTASLFKDGYRTYVGHVSYVMVGYKSRIPLVRGTQHSHAEC